MTPTLRAILTALNTHHRKATTMPDQTTGPADWTPAHYRGDGLQPFDVINAFGLDFYEGNALKYLLRWRKKNGVEDLCKARTYLQVLIDRATGADVIPDSAEDIDDWGDAPADVSPTPAPTPGDDDVRDRLASWLYDHCAHDPGHQGISDDPRTIAHYALLWPELPQVFASDVEAERDGAYRERAHLVAYLAAVYPSHIGFTDPNAPGWAVVIVETPAGQMSWHVSPRDMELFDHVQSSDRICRGWDGHTTEEKYQRLSQLTIDAVGPLTPASEPGPVELPDCNDPAHVGYTVGGEHLHGPAADA